MKKRFFFLGVLLVFIVSFIAINIFLVYKIKDLRSEQTFYRLMVKQAIDIERGSFKHLINIDDYSKDELNESLEFFLKKDAHLTDSRYLDSLNLRLVDLKSYANNSADYLQPKLIKVLYAHINMESRRAIKSLKRVNAELDDELSSCLRYNSFVIIMASCLGVSVLVLSFFQFKTNSAYFKVNRLHNLLLDSSINLIMISDEKGKVVKFNKAFEDAFGYSLSEVQNLGRKILFDDPLDDDKLSASLNEKGYFKGEIVNRRKNGEIFTTFLTATVIRNEEGKKIGLLGISRDITEEKKEIQKGKNQSKEINKSIEYASGLQKASLPSCEVIRSLFPEHFLLFKPKDTLSGDFYLIEKETKPDNSEVVYLVVADCTGHGIPGAILSTYCSEVLKSSFKMDSIHSPSEILDFARIRISQFFNSNKTKNIYDGMDAAICKFDFQENILHFSGANCCCYIIRNGVLIKLTATKQSVCFSEKPTPFIDHSIKLEKGDAIYLSTDGYMDQFGGPKNKKFMKSRLTDLLLSMSHLPIPEQGKIIEEAFYKWKGNEDQTDDVLLFALRV